MEGFAKSTIQWACNWFPFFYSNILLPPNSFHG